ncbi:MAG: winged helix-turn-helix transcriptional regulator [Acidimicrobiales bacterium]|nr:winged helix-turn-helix transcriptional regulator [Acidimicrobiales bacterium]
MEVATFSALGEPSRLRIVELLRAGPASVGEIVEALGLRQPQVSKHLRVLHDVGLVSADAVSRQRIYHLESEPFEAIAAWVDSFEALWDARLDSLGRYLEALPSDPNDPTTPDPAG